MSKKSLFFTKKNYFFLQKKVTFFYKKKLLFFAKKSTSRTLDYYNLVGESLFSRSSRELRLTRVGWDPSDGCVMTSDVTG